LDFEVETTTIENRGLSVQSVQSGLSLSHRAFANVKLSLIHLGWFLSNDLRMKEYERERRLLKREQRLREKQQALS
jgi:hypothetical protein